MLFWGEDVLGDPVQVDGWTNDNVIFTHTAGKGGELGFNTSATENENYLLEFDTSYKSGEFVRVGFGKSYRILTYNGNNHITAILNSGEDNVLYFTPFNSNLTGTVSNITLRKIQNVGEEKMLPSESVYTINHVTNYGFWNVLLGGNTLGSSSGSTRTIAIGYNALRKLKGGHRNIGIGTFSMANLLDGEMNTSMGADSMLSVQHATSSVALGFGSMYYGKNLLENVAIGK